MPLWRRILSVSVTFLTILFWFAATVAFIDFLLTGCGPSLSYEQAVMHYEAEELSCVADASTKDATDSCRASVRSKYCGDGGPLAGSCR